MNTEKCVLRLFGVLMALLSPVTLGLGIADVTLTYYYFCVDQAPYCQTLDTSLALTWVAVGIWASIPVFANGIGAIWISGHLEAHRSWFCLLTFMSAVIFTPALIVISCFEVWTSFPNGVSSDTMQSKALFGMEISIAVIGFVLHLFALMLFYYVCCCRTRREERRTETVSTKIDALPQQLVPQQQHVPSCQHDQQPQDLDRMNLWSAYRWMNNGGMAAPSCQKPAGGNYYIGAATPNRCNYQSAGNCYAVGGNYQMPRQVLAGGGQATRW